MDSQTRPAQPSEEPLARQSDGSGSRDRLLEALEEGVLVLDGDRVAWTNAALQRMAGTAKEVLVGRLVTELLADAQGRPLRPAAPEAGCRLRNARGDLIPVSLESGGDHTWIVQDRARERRLEAEVFRLSEERRRVPLEGAPETLPGPEFLGMIEHEIRTATTVIHGYTRMLQDGRVGPVTPVQADFLCETRRATERISSLLDNLLDLSSLECPSGLRIVRKPIRLHDVIRSAADAVRPLYEDRSSALSLELDSEQDAIRGDAGRLEQVFINLLSNAVKFSPAGSEVRLTTEADGVGGAIEVSVIDQGPGVSADERERIFRPFVRGAAAALEGASGVGLGLAICQRILEAHLGTIEAVSGPGHGLFRLCLPYEPGETRGEGSAT